MVRTSGARGLSEQPPARRCIPVCATIKQPHPKGCLAAWWDTDLVTASLACVQVCHPIWSPQRFSRTSLVPTHISDHADQKEITCKMTYPSLKGSLTPCDSIPLLCCTNPE